MVNATRFPVWAAMLLGAVVLTAAAWLRGAEYDEQYTLFLTAGVARPVWPDLPFPAGLAVALQTGHASLFDIARDLRTTDVHPPLYFWAVSWWRDAFGPGLFIARLLSVSCALASLRLVAHIARRCAIPPVPAMLLTLGCYGFVYTSAIARGFASAEMLTLGGVSLLLARRPMLAGLAFGMACGCNYLAVFIAVATCTAAGAWRALPTALPFLALDAWFFAAQHGARPDQFPPFEIWPSIVRLVRYQIAAVFGGLPLYVDGAGRTVAEAMVGLAALSLAMLIVRAGPLTAERRLLGVAAAAPLVGLLLLGAVFNNTPIELRYLSFGLPFIGMMAASPPYRHAFFPAGAASASRPVSIGVFSFLNKIGRMGLSWRPVFSKVRHLTRWNPGRAFILVLQSAGVVGLLLAPRTMQPARLAATEAAHYADDALVLLPAGNDGVGIVGAFAIETAPTLPLLLVHPTDRLVSVPAQYRRVILGLLAQDHDSLATLPVLRAAVAGPNWRRIAIGSNLEVYEKTIKEH